MYEAWTVSFDSTLLYHRSRSRCRTSGRKQRSRPDNRRMLHHKPRRRHLYTSDRITMRRSKRPMARRRHTVLKHHLRKHCAWWLLLHTSGPNPTHLPNHVAIHVRRTRRHIPRPRLKLQRALLSANPNRRLLLHSSRHHSPRLPDSDRSTVR